MIEMTVRGYHVVVDPTDIGFYGRSSVPSPSYADACHGADAISEFSIYSVTVERDPLILDGEEIEGVSTVARFVNGKKVFPI